MSCLIGVFKAQFDETGYVMPVVIIENIRPITTRHSVTEGPANIVSELAEEQTTGSPFALAVVHHILDDFVRVVVPVGPFILIVIKDASTYHLAQRAVPQVL
jgi:hypothetical protein